VSIRDTDIPPRFTFYRTQAGAEVDLLVAGDLSPWDRAALSS
jgi:hypothetical protein